LAALYSFPLRPWTGHYTYEVANYVTYKPQHADYRGSHGECGARNVLFQRIFLRSFGR